MDNQKNIIINRSIGETRMALMDKGTVTDIRLYRDHEPSYVGAVYLGRVKKLSSELQAAFVELGNGMDGFLPLKNLPKERGKKPKDLTTLLHEGQSLIVQVTSDAAGDKSPKLTARPELVSTAIVLHPFRLGAYVSSRIKNPDRRAELKEFGEELVPDYLGMTFRTESENIANDQLKQTATQMVDHWRVITKGLKTKKCPSLLTQGPEPIEQIMREFSAPDIDNIIIDQPSAQALAANWAKSFAPDQLPKITAYKESGAIFDTYGVSDDLEGIAEAHIALPSGAWITIEATEALTAIDVNMGSALISSNKETQIFAINREAAREVFRQVRLRGIGGLIIIDFIDMSDKGKVKSLLHFVDELMLLDTLPIQRGNMSSFGLLELSRKSLQLSLNNQILERRSLIKNIATSCLDQIRNAEGDAKTNPGLPVTVKVNKNTKKWLENHSEIFDEFKARTGSELKMELL
ncbi:MAG: ribonuclease E/G [Emcibacteraceae bacterium]|nr:ribonuclease E/G [Emcibacteraceae bacterium]